MRRILYLLLLAASISCAQTTPQNQAGANNNWVIVGNPAQQFSPTQKGTIQDAINYAGVGGVVWIPPNYAGSEDVSSLVNPNNVLIIDMRNGTFKTLPALTSPGGNVTPVATLVVGPTSTIQFGTVQANTDSQTQPVSISNAGGAATIITAITFPPNSPFSATVSPNPCLGPAPSGVTCVFNTKYHPTSSTANDSATVVISTTTPADPLNPTPLTFSLAGQGAAGATVPITFADFGAGSGTLSDGANLSATFTAGQCVGCTISYPVGATPVLTATPLPGSVFGGFSGTNLNGTTSPATLTVSTAQTVSVTFNLSLPSPTITLAATGQGVGTMVSDAPSTNGAFNCGAISGVVSSGGAQGCSGPFVQGTTVKFTATAGLNSTFLGWTGASSCGASVDCTIVVGTNPLTLTANFGTTGSSTPLSLVQTTTNCTAASSTIACIFAAAQNAGDFNVCAANWPDATTTVASFSDTANGAYTQVPTISPKVGTNLTQALYYFQNIAAANAGANTVTATLSSSAGSTVTVANLTKGQSSTSNTAYSSASVTPAANQPVLLTAIGRLASGNGPVSMTPSGDGLTWTKIQEKNFGATEGTGKSNWLAQWCGSAASPSTGAITMTWGASLGQTAWIIDQSANAASGCAAAIGIAAVNSQDGATASPLTVTMGTFAAPSSATYGVGDFESAAVTLTAAANMTSVANEPGSSVQLTSEYNSGNISPVTETYTGTSQRWAIAAVEIKPTTNRRDMRCAEYSGVKTSGSPVDVSAAATGTSAAASSGGVTTGTANDLVIGATASNQSVSAVSTNYVQQIKDTFGDDLEDRQGVAVATYPFAPTLASSGNWIASQVAFLAGSTVTPTTFSITVNNAGNGTVISNVGTPQVNCGATCSSVVSAGSSATLTANPAPNAVFVQWVGITGCSTSPICQVPNITSNQNVTAVFALNGAQNYYLAPSGSGGSDSNDGLAPTVGGGHGPWATLAHAESSSGFQLGPGGAVLNFAPSATAYTASNISRGGSSQTVRLVLKCSSQFTVGGTNCKFSGGLQITTASNVDVGAIPKQGFEFTGASIAASIDVNWQCGVNPTCSTGNSIHAFGNYIHDTSQSVGNGCPSSGAILIPNIHGGTSPDAQVAGNLIDHIGLFPNPSGNQQQGIYVATANGQVYDNIVMRVCYAGLQYYDQGAGARISNNVFANNTVGMVLYGQNGVTPGLNTVDNNVIVNNTQQAVNNNFGGDLGCSSGKPTLYASNIFFGNGSTFSSTPASCTTVQNQLSENPSATFVNYTGDATGNYQLKSTSIAVNGGTTQCVQGGAVPCVPPFDFLNTTRPQRANIDIGAFELP